METDFLTYLSLLNNSAEVMSILESFGRTACIFW